MLLSEKEKDEGNKFENGMDEHTLTVRPSSVKTKSFPYLGKAVLSSMF